jgi:hypothetical protein
MGNLNLSEAALALPHACVVGDNPRVDAENLED